jgi:hypothetical protein
MEDLKINVKSVGWACKQHLLDESTNSDYLQETATIKEYKLFREWIKNLTNEQAISVVFEQKYKPDTQGVNGIDDKARTIAKIGLAAALGGLVGNTLSAKHNMAFGIGGLVAAASTVMYMLYKTYNDKCHQKCKPERLIVGRKKSKEYTKCYVGCSLTAANQVLSQIRAQKGKCAGTKNPDKCKQHIEMLEIKWVRKIKILNDRMRSL